VSRYTGRSASWREREPSAHERAHERACLGEGIPHRWVNRGGDPVVEGRTRWTKAGSLKGAVVLVAGAMAGGGDAAGDWEAAAGLAREAGVSMDEVKRKARRYL
jgi:hypothetical protein